jgi:hypothetical protein
MDEQKHRIGRQVLELTIPDRDQALSIQNSTSNLVKYKLNPALDKLFSGLTTSEDVFMIDRLVLDLGDVSLDEFDDEMVTKAVEALENKLLSLLQEQKDAKTAVDKPSESTEGEIKLISKPQSIFERLVHYLKTGMQPWWQSSDETLSMGKLIAELGKEPPKQHIEIVMQLLESETIRRRIAFQLDKREFNRFLRLFVPARAKGYSRIIGKIAADKLSPPRSISQLLRYYLLDAVYQKSTLSESDTILSVSQRLIYDFLDEKDAKELRKRMTALLKHFDTANIPAKVKRKIFAMIVLLSKAQKLRLTKGDRLVLGKYVSDEEIKALEVLASLKYVTEEDLPTRKDKEEPRKTAAVTKEETSTDKPMFEDLLKDDKAFDDLTDEQRETLEELLDSYQKDIELRIKKEEEAKKPRLRKDGLEIFVHNAGLILLHPFLPYLFDGLGFLTEEKRFKTENEAYRAVHILQYLATNETATPEHELTFNKIMCGLEPDEPVPFDVELTDDEKVECENLLRVVLERWDALKTSKPEALQEGFLRREGRLFFKGNGWNIIIERMTLDIMLDKLPWSISMIKMPWRDDLIYVEW